MFLPLPHGRSSRLRLPHPLLLPTGRRSDGGPRVRRPFRGPRAAPVAQEVNEKGPGKSSDGVTPLLRVGGCLSAHLRRWQSIAEFLGVVRLAGRLPHPLPGLSSSSLSLPGIVSDVPGGISSLPGVAPRGREDAVQGRPGNRPRSGSRLLQSPFSCEKGDGGLATRDRPLSPERVCSPHSVQDGDSCLCAPVRQRGDFLASIDLKDAYFQIPVHRSSRKLLRFLSEGTVYQFKALCFGLSTAPQIFTSVFAAVSAWAHSHGIRLLRYLDDWLVLASSEVEARRHVWDLLSLLSLPRDSDKRGQVRSRSLTDSELPGYDHRYRGRQDLSVSCASREISVGGGDVLCFDRSPSSALAGALGSPGFAGEAGPARSPSNALPAVAFEDALAPRVRFSFPSGAPAPGCVGGPVLVDGAGPSSHGGSIRDTCSQIYTCTRTPLDRGGAHTSSIGWYPGCGRTRRSSCTSISWK